VPRGFQSDSTTGLGLLVSQQPKLNTGGVSESGGAKSGPEIRARDMAEIPTFLGETSECPVVRSKGCITVINRTGVVKGPFLSWIHLSVPNCSYVIKRSHTGMSCPG
jgi:hypothetical protein